MRYDRFRVLARGMFDEIPPPFREGVVALVVEPGAHEHPGLPGVYTLGECITQGWPDPVGGGGETQSQILLYHGSFESLAEGDPLFDWKAELWETVLHELLHHREAAADEDSLDRFDYAVDQNFLRLAGRPFDPEYPKYLPRDVDGAARLDGETFVEAVAPAADRGARFRWREREWLVGMPPGGTHVWVRVRNLAGGRLWVVVRRPVPWWWRLVGRARTEPLLVERRALPAPRDEG